ncbi:MAG: ABC transporter permease [Anaerolineaceae bacterium]|nr:ABC transporter permease [Anaerolineaceae bacterium]
MRRIKQFAWRDRLPLILFTGLFLAVIIVFQILQPQFLSTANIINIAQSVSTTVIAAIGLTFVIAIRRVDISFYMTSCFCGVLMAWLVSLGWNPVFAILAGVAAGAGWGSVSGIAVGKFKLPDIITTIAIGSIAFGLGYLFSDGAFIMKNFIEAKTHYWSQFLVLGIPLPVYVMALVILVAYYILELSRSGRNFYAIGATEKAAYLSGINVNRMIIMAYVICGTLAAVAATIMTAKQGYGNVKISMNLLMPCFTAVYIGISVFKRPCVIGTFFGALLVTSIATGFTSINIPYFWSNLVTGIVLIIAIMLSKIVVREKRPVSVALEKEAST